jgi:hypothetical protein
MPIMVQGLKVGTNENEGGLKGGEFYDWSQAVMFFIFFLI